MGQTLAQLTFGRKSHALRLKDYLPATTAAQLFWKPDASSTEASLVYFHSKMK